MCVWVCVCVCVCVEDTVACLLIVKIAIKMPLWVVVMVEADLLYSMTL